MGFNCTLNHALCGEMYALGNPGVSFSAEADSAQTGFKEDEFKLWLSRFIIDRYQPPKQIYWSGRTVHMQTWRSTRWLGASVHINMECRILSQEFLLTSVQSTWCTCHSYKAPVMLVGCCGYQRHSKPWQFQVPNAPCPVLKVEWVCFNPWETHSSQLGVEHSKKRCRFSLPTDSWRRTPHWLVTWQFHTV